MESGNYIIQLLDKKDITGEKNYIFKEEYQSKIFHINIADKDRFTYLFNSILIENKKNQPQLQPEDLQQRASKLCEKVTYLVEELTAVELDSTTGIIMLRSKLSKNAVDSIINYFEVTINRDRAVSVKRFSNNKQTKVTEDRVFNLTTELAEKFLIHLTETIA